MYHPYAQSPLRNRFSSETQFSSYSNRTSASEGSNLSTQHALINIPQRAQWVCTACSVPNEFKDTSELRPLGQLKCAVCRNVSDGSVEIRDFPRLQLLPGQEYKLSIPPFVASPYPPRTVFVWACCNAGCGRSHVEYPTKVRRSQERPPLQPRKSSIRDHVWNPLRRSTSLNKSKHVINDEMHTQRRIYEVKFEKTCGCNHKMCRTCLRGVVSQEEEWVVRVYDELLP
jgi:hypothetical protein